MQLVVTLVHTALICAGMVVLYSWGEAPVAWRGHTKHDATHAHLPPPSENGDTTHAATRDTDTQAPDR